MIATVQHNAFMQAYGYQTQAAGDTAQAGLYSSEASQATALEPLSIATGLAGSASQGAGMYANFVNAGLIPKPSGATNGG